MDRVYKFCNDERESLSITTFENYKFYTNTHSTNFDFCAVVSGIHDRKVIHVYGKRHERPVVYFTLVCLAGRYRPRIAAQFEYMIERISSSVSSSFINLLCLRLLININNKCAIFFTANQNNRVLTILSLTISIHLVAVEPASTSPNST